MYWLLLIALPLLLILIFYFWISYLRLVHRDGMKSWIRNCMIIHSIVTIAYGMIFVLPAPGFIILILFLAIELQMIPKNKSD